MCIRDSIFRRERIIPSQGSIFSLGREMRAVEGIALLIEVRPLQAPAQALLRMYARRRARPPHQHGGGLIDDCIAQGSRPPAEIHIAEVPSELLIKSPKLLKYLSLIHISEPTRPY